MYSTRLIDYNVYLDKDYTSERQSSFIDIIIPIWYLKEKMAKTHLKLLGQISNGVSVRIFIASSGSLKFRLTLTYLAILVYNAPEHFIDLFFSLCNTNQRPDFKFYSFIKVISVHTTHKTLHVIAMWLYKHCPITVKSVTLNNNNHFNIRLNSY